LKTNPSLTSLKDIDTTLDRKTSLRMSSALDYIPEQASIIATAIDDEVDSTAPTPTLGPMHPPHSVISLDSSDMHTNTHNSNSNTKPRLTLSAYRRTAIRLTPADPTQRFEDSYDLHAPGCRVLGHGAFSTVRLAVRKHDGIQVAVKTIAKHDALRAQRLRVGGRRYLEEWEILRRMHQHPYIIDILDLFESDDEIQLVMEYCQGGELFDAIQKKRNRFPSARRGQYSERQAACVTSQILRALADLHAQGIVHRDVKPENILLVSDDDDCNIHVKLADFGVARSLAPELVTPGDGDVSPLTPNRQRSFSIVGSNYYVAPEVHYGSTYDAAVDIYSLGVTLYILLCGFPPVFSGPENNAEVVFPVSYWKDISEEAKDLVRAMVTSDTESRITADEALRNRWIVANMEGLTSPSRIRRREMSIMRPEQPVHLDLNRLYKSLGALQQVSKKRSFHASRSDSPHKRAKMERRTSSALIALADLYRVTSPPRVHALAREPSSDLRHSLSNRDEVDRVPPFRSRNLNTAFLSA
jgi:serine/threonine protein kinase